MKRIVFIEAEGAEQDWLTGAMAEHELHFASDLSEMDGDPQIVSVFINSPIDRDFLDRHGAVELITTRSTTTEHIDLKECAARRVPVCNVPTYGEHTVAEHTFALMLGLARRLREAMDASRHTTFSYEQLRGSELRGKTLGVVGAGSVGQIVIRMAKCFGLDPIVSDIQPNVDLARELGFAYVGFDEMLARSDIITLHAPLTAQTYHLFDRAAFAKCRPGVLIVNTARGRLIDTTALCEALDSGTVAGAGLDVLEDERVMRQSTAHLISSQIVDRLHSSFPPRELRAPDNSRISELHELMMTHKLLGRTNVLFTPHIAFNSVEAVERILVATVENIRAFVARSPINLVTVSSSQL
jgi:D-lactate dehydrogenase